MVQAHIVGRYIFLRLIEETTIHIHHIKSADYAKSLIDMIIKYQLGKINEIKEYTGENVKVSCDSIETSNELVKEQWDYFVMDMASASDEKIKGKYHGYVLEGIPASRDEKTVVFLKMANPIINLKNRRSAVFTFDNNSELAEMSDEVFKLHMNTDLFNVEKTMQKIKHKALEEIVTIDAFENREEFEQMARAYKSPRTFITLKRERVERIKNKTKRKK